jgi:porin
MTCWAQTATKDLNKNHAPEAIPGAPIREQENPGTGQLGQWLGLSPNSPLRIGGLWVGNASAQASGGIPTNGRGGLAQQALLGLRLDMAKTLHWQGASLLVQGLQVNVQNTAAQAAGSLQGTNNLAAAPPLNRTELYSYLLRQELFNQQVNVVIGKQAPSTTFANVMRPMTSLGATFAEPFVTGLPMTPPYAMPTLQGKLPGYPDSALGATVIIEPQFHNRSTYVEAGLYDGRQATGIATGLVSPSLSGALFSIVEAGARWYMDNGKKPGSMGLGSWYQSGVLTPGVPGTNLKENGTYGSYLIGSQRLINFRPKRDHSGITSFVQAGWTASTTATMTANLGGGITVFSPFAKRPKDSYGFGLSWAQVNTRSTLSQVWNPQELMIQAYAQIHLFGSSFLTPALTYLPMAGVKSAGAPSVSAILQLVVQF